MSSGIARYLNGIVNLEDIDKSLSNIQSMLRKETNQLEECRLSKGNLFLIYYPMMGCEVDKQLSQLESERKNQTTRGAKLQFKILSNKLR